MSSLSTECFYIWFGFVVLFLVFPVFVLKRKNNFKFLWHANKSKLLKTWWNRKFHHWSFFSSLLSYQQLQVFRGCLVGVLMRRPTQVSTHSQIWKSQRIATLYPQPRIITSTPPNLVQKSWEPKGDVVYLWTPSIPKTLLLDK